MITGFPSRLTKSMLKFLFILFTRRAYVHRCYRLTSTSAGLQYLRGMLLKLTFRVNLKYYHQFINQ